MEKEKLESLLIDYIDGNLDAAGQQQAEQMLQQNAEARIIYEELKTVMHVMDESAMLQPTSKMQQDFMAMLKKETEVSTGPKQKVIVLSPWSYRIAAAVLLLMIGGGAGFWISQYQKQQQEIAKVREEMERMKHHMMALLENDQSASQRVLGATVAYNDLEKADTEIVQALIHAMNEDPNTNVRLAALEALGKFKQEATVRKALIDALTTQKDPLVQITLIRMLVDIKEKKAIQGLEDIILDQEVLKEVKDEAHAGLLKLT